MDFNKYKEKMNQLVVQCNKLDSIAKIYTPQVHKNITEAKKNINNESFQLVVVGEFSRGKSTFINALLGKRILPASINPTTAVLSKIVYGKIPEYTLYYNDGNVKTIGESEFKKLVAPKEVNKHKLDLLKIFRHKQDDLNKIEHAEIAYPLELCKDNVDIVDTPGTNDLSTLRLDITYNYINKADAVIMLLGASQALNASEVEFLKGRILNSYIQDIFFVINKKDEIPVADQQNVIDYVKKNLLSIDGMPKKLRLHLISSKQALLYRRNANGEDIPISKRTQIPDNLAYTGLADFESELGHFLSDEKGMSKIGKYVKLFSKIAGQVYTDIARRHSLVQHSSDDLFAKLNKMKPEFENAKSMVRAYMSCLQVNLQNEIHQFNGACDMAKQDIHINIKNIVKNNLDLEEAELKAEIEKCVLRSEDKLISKIQAIEEEAVKKEINNINKKIKKIWYDLELGIVGKDISINSLQIEKGKMDLQLDIEASAGSEDDYIGTGLLLGGAFAILSGAALLPALVVGAVIGWLFGNGYSVQDSQEDRINKACNKISMQCADEIDKFNEKVKKSYTNGIADICATISNDVDSGLKVMESQLEEVIVLKKNKQKDINKEIVQLEQHQKELELIVKKLAALAR